MATKKKIPMRMCVGCREMHPKKELLRVVRNKEGALDIDLNGKAPGRGAYVCPKRTCLERAVKSKAMDKALEAKVAPEIYEALMERLPVENAE
ncbi:YlxR family protein [Christensenellaceae bacterium OttesenSCG-928-M15]|nr:YlxR family protein [Christensenellaceae bacterium OttesenSCG-928-M15]